MSRSFSSRRQWPQPAFHLVNADAKIIRKLGYSFSALPPFRATRCRGHASRYLDPRARLAFVAVVYLVPGGLGRTLAEEQR